MNQPEHELRRQNPVKDLLDKARKKKNEIDYGEIEEVFGDMDLSDSDYLYDYGEYISDVELAMATYMATLNDDDICIMADTFTEGYRKGFIATGKDISIKKTVEIRYFLGFERVVRKAVENFRKIGLEAIIHYSTPSFMLGRSVIKRGIESTSPNRQFDYFAMSNS